MTTSWSVEAATTTELASGFGAAGLRAPNYTKDEKELFLLRRYLFTLAANALLPFPLRVVRSERPDFYIYFSDEQPVALEITEGTIPADAKERALARKADSIHLIGQYCGRGRGGFDGDAPERLWCADVIRALRRKLKKPYAKGRFQLLIYTNSNPSLVVYADSATKMLRTKLDGRKILGIEPSSVHTSIISGDWDFPDNCLIYNATRTPLIFPLVRELA